MYFEDDFKTENILFRKKKNKGCYDEIDEIKVQGLIMELGILAYMTSTWWKSNVKGSFHLNGT